MRQYFTYQVPGEPDVSVEVHIDQEEKLKHLVSRLVRRALKNKSKTAKSAHGVITVKVKGNG